MYFCSWRENPISRLPQKIASGTFHLAVNSEILVSFGHLGGETLVPARCRLCPYFFEGECTYPPSAALSEGQAPKLAAWAAGAGENPVAAANTASTELKARLGATVPAYVAIVLTYSGSTTPAELNEALQKALAGLPEEVGFSLSVELSENPGSLVLICAWAAG